MRSSKFQPPSTGEIPMTKHKAGQRTRRSLLGRLKFGASLDVGAWCFVFFLAATAHAQSYSVDWFTVDGGGGTSTGGVYSVSGTVGQPDAGRISGGNYSLDGGFWGIVAAIQTPGAPYLFVSNSGGVVIVSWLNPAEGFVLDQTPALASPPATISWSQISTTTYQTNVTHIYITVPAPAGNKFYRLRRL
jgi:hypothetical protein